MSELSFRLVVVTLREDVYRFFSVKMLNMGALFLLVKFDRSPELDELQFSCKFWIYCWAFSLGGRVILFCWNHSAAGRLFGFMVDILVALRVVWGNIATLSLWNGHALIKKLVTVNWFKPCSLSYTHNTHFSYVLINGLLLDYRIIFWPDIVLFGNLGLERNVWDWRLRSFCIILLFLIYLISNGSRYLSWIALGVVNLLVRLIRNFLFDNWIFIGNHVLRKDYIPKERWTLRSHLKLTVKVGWVEGSNSILSGDVLGVLVSAIFVRVPTIVG